MESHTRKQEAHNPVTTPDTLSLGPHDVVLTACMVAVSVPHHKETSGAVWPLECRELQHRSGAGAPPPEKDAVHSTHVLWDISKTELVQNVKQL